MTRSRHGYITLHDGRVWVIGGINNGHWATQDTSEIFDPVTGTWSPGPTLPSKNTEPCVAGPLDPLGAGTEYMVAEVGTQGSILSQVETLCPQCAIKLWNLNLKKNLFLVRGKEFGRTILLQPRGLQSRITGMKNFYEA